MSMNKLVLWAWAALFVVATIAAVHYWPHARTAAWGNVALAVISLVGTVKGWRMNKPTNDNKT